MTTTNTAPRTYKGHLIGFERVTNRYWIGGKGYVYHTEYLVWNPANRERTVLMTKDEFHALTRPALRPVEAAKVFSDRAMRPAA
ncbi:MAG: hypothetical protein AAFV01_10695 [Bacteroidota bacterium]